MKTTNVLLLAIKMKKLQILLQGNIGENVKVGETGNYLWSKK